MTAMTQQWLQEPNLASRKFGATVMWANDEFFAERENLVTAAEPEYRPHTFGLKGQVYDGWETRRRRDHLGETDTVPDQAIVRLGLPGTVSGLVVDTAFFTGNYPPHASVDAVNLDGYPSIEELHEAKWEEILPKSALTGDGKNFFDVDSVCRYTHVRLNIFPDGGVARLRVHGAPIVNPKEIDVRGLDLAALENGGRIVGCSNMFYSSPNNLISPGLAQVMGDGWETARRRDDGNDWIEVELAAEGVVRILELDTSHFKGNSPGWAQVSGKHGDSDWQVVLPKVALQPDTRHRFAIGDTPTVTHVRLDIFPDGGMARLRVHGALTDSGIGRLVTHWTQTH